MFNKKKIGIGILTTAFGIIFLLMGIILVFFEMMWSINIEWGGMQYTPHLFEYGYQFLGLMMTFIGIAFLIFGIRLWHFKYTKKDKGGFKARPRLHP
jgi:uncharacterized membrane protein